MTVIAIKDGVLACDSGVFAGGCYAGSIAKAALTPGGGVVAGAGEAGAVAALLAAALRGEVVDKVAEGTWCLRLEPDGTVLALDGPHEGWFRFDAPFAALGSGANVALGAMAAGASAERAVEIACEWAEGCRGPVRIFKAGERP